MRPGSDPSSFDSIDQNDAAYYTRFLDARTTIQDERRVKQQILSLLRPSDGLAVLDVGSGTGVDTCAVASAVGRSGRVIGLDHSQHMVEESRRRAAGSGLPVEFLKGDALALPFDDESFDRCRAERVLSHLGDPAKAIREMVRVTRPDGIVVVSDLDTETLFVNSSNTRLARSLVVALTDELPSARIGRRLRRLFVEEGLAGVECLPTVVLNNVAFMRIVLGGRLDRMVAAGETSAGQVDDFWAELERGEEEGWLCSGIVCFTAVGRKAP